MTIYFMGGEAGAFVPSDGNLYEDTNAWSGTKLYSDAFSRCALAAVAGGASSTYWESAAFTSLTSGYVHAHLSTRAYAGGTQYPLALVDDTGNTVIRLEFDQASNVLSLRYKNSGGSWVTVGSFTIGLEDATHDMDIAFEVNSATADLALYVAGTERVSGTVDLAHVGSIESVRIYTARFGSRGSQVIVADEPTIGWRLMTAYPSGVGANSDWSGSYTSVDEISSTSNWDADFVFSDTNGDVSTFALTTVGGLTGYTVRAVGVSARAKKGASGPSNLQLVLRSGGTDYTSSSQALSVGYGAYVAVWEQDPNTTADWLNASISSLQAGVKAIT